MIEIEWNFEEPTNFLENLNFQIAKIYGFYKKIPMFYKKLEDLENQYNLLENKRRRDAYKVVMSELEYLIQSYKNKR